ncbi:ABC transporter permease [Chryseosolibacter indicus]|uniref:ABC transporter permease n=1 Tax=Chryseosolibacter indicus TaxID=2782351 RepID=A0ABS5VKF7_9BACT|nr:ABC transporter permease [Chryseosolibacter indicus]MBT1701934.1 ABC transporter permease [Chryseosolibacter indicus]
MLRNYIIIALRLLVKNKVFSLINILGLSTGIACCILITLYIQDEFNYEKGFSEREKIFRINTTFVKDGVAETTGNASPPIAPGLAQVLPEIETFTRVMKPLNTEINIVRYKDNSFFEKKAFLVDSTFLDVFPYQLIEGNAATALDAPSTALISQKLSEKIFGKRSPLDELIIINSGTAADTFRVTGVVAPSEFPSHVDADIYMSMNSNGWGQWVLNQTTWANNNIVGSYIKLQEPETYKNVEAKLPGFVEMHAGNELRQSGRNKILKLQPLDEVRLYSDIRTDASSDTNSSSITYIYIIGTIGIFILLLACINFMNLTTAKSAQRAGEVGIRKSMGAFRNNLIRQFLGESLVIVAFALVLAFLMVVFALPFFNEIMQKHLAFTGNNLPFIISATLFIAATTGLLAGSYPAFFLSSLKPTSVLKGKSLSSDGSQWLRKGLVVFQFVITITLISSIVIIQQQLKYVQTKSLGFTTDQVVMIPMRTAQASGQYTTLKSAFEALEGVGIVSATSSIPSTPLSRDWGVYKEGSSNDQSVTHDIISVDAEYFNALNIDLIAGRDFIVGQDNLPNDTINPIKIIVNEASLKEFDIPLDKAVGSRIFFEPGSERYELSIIGVVNDFHQFSLHRKIRPMLFMLSGNRDYFPYMAVTIEMKSFQQTQAKMKALWDERINDAPFESIFLNENIKTLYAAEKRTSTLLTISTTIALIISCLGLYGLSVYVAERKTKEIGIRKVVGASVQSIVTMLSKEYIRLIVISFVISVPLGYYAMNKWLEGFAYKISPGITVFLISGMIAFLIAWLTISFESIRAASKNPVDTFRVN